MGWLGDLGNALTGGALNLLGKFGEDKFISDPNSAEAFSRQKYLMQNRYQWMMNDMQKAGLNPILAAGSMGFQAPSPSVQQSQLPTGDYAASAREFAESKTEREKATLFKRQGRKAVTEAISSIVGRARTVAEAERAKQETKNLKRQWHILDQTFNLVSQQAYLTLAQREKMEVTVAQMKANLEKMKKMGNVFHGPLGQVLTYLRAVTEAFGLSTSVRY